MVILLGEIGDDIDHIFVGDRMHRNVPLGNSLAAPAKPHASVTLERWPYRDFKAAGTIGAIAAGDAHPVRDDDQPCQDRPFPSCAKPATDCPGNLRWGFTRLRTTANCLATPSHLRMGRRPHSENARR